MFITFYSYKGGVGRTMALANVAYLLAMDKEEPCKVLVWDFDLEGPGLQHIFRFQWAGRGEGFVDLVYNYLERAELPDITDYIYRTDTEGVDILPAGKINKAYSQKLDQINWRAIYAEARGYDFIQSVKEKIVAKGYDYVLVDSRTGYSDVGGICTMQLPEVVVLLFRLNEQNIHGAKKVYDAIKAHQETYNKEIRVIPVISPAWPFGALEANNLVRKVQRTFHGLEVEEISFEAALSFGEKIISRERNRYASALKICEDYSRLVRRLRELNIDDPQTLYRNARRKRRDDQYPEAFELFKKLIRRRPGKDAYWRELLQTTQLGSRGEGTRSLSHLGARELREELYVFTEEFMEREPKNHLPYMTRAVLAYIEGHVQEALKLYTEAVRLSPNFEYGYLGRAEAYHNLGRIKEAIEDLNRAIELDPRRAYAYKHRAHCRLHFRQFTEARDDFTRAIELNPNDKDSYLLRARTSFLQGMYDEALADAERYISSNADVDGIVLKAHILSALGRETEAVSLLDRAQSARPKDVSSLLDLAEAYLVTGGQGTSLRLIEQASRLIKTSRHKIIALFLQACAIALAGEKYNDAADKLRLRLKEEHEVAANLGWELETLRRSLDCALKQGRIIPRAAGAITELMSLLKQPWLKSGH